MEELGLQCEELGLLCDPRASELLTWARGWGVGVGIRYRVCSFPRTPTGRGKTKGHRCTNLHSLGKLEPWAMRPGQHPGMVTSGQSYSFSCLQIAGMASPWGRQETRASTLQAQRCPPGKDGRSACRPGRTQCPEPGASRSVCSFTVSSPVCVCVCV